MVAKEKKITVKFNDEPKRMAFVLNTTTQKHLAMLQVMLEKHPEEVLEQAIKELYQKNISDVVNEDH